MTKPKFFSKISLSRQYFKPFSVAYASIKPMHGKTEIILNSKNQVIKGLIKIEKTNSSLFKAYIIFHERIHELINKSSLDYDIMAVLDGFHDLIDYLASDFKKTFAKLKKNEKDLSFLVSHCITRYKAKVEIFNEFHRKGLKIGKQTKLADFKEFKPIVEAYNIMIKRNIELRKQLRTGSNPSKQTVLAANPKNKTKMGVVT